MAGEILTFQYILVNQQPDAFFPVIHKPHDRHGSGFDVKERLHEFCLPKGQAGASNLLGQDSCLELFIAWHEQQVKVGLLGIAEEKILADFRAQKLVYLATGFNGGKGVVVHTDKGDLKEIQQIVGADFLFLTAGCVGGTALIKGMLNIVCGNRLPDQ